MGIGKRVFGGVVAVTAIVGINKACGSDGQPEVQPDVPPTVFVDVNSGETLPPLAPGQRPPETIITVPAPNVPPATLATDLPGQAVGSAPTSVPIPEGVGTVAVIDGKAVVNKLPSDPELGFVLDPGSEGNVIALAPGTVPEDVGNDALTEMSAGGQPAQLAEGTVLVPAGLASSLTADAPTQDDKAAIAQATGTVPELPTVVVPTTRGISVGD